MDNSRLTPVEFDTVGDTDLDLMGAWGHGPGIDVADEAIASFCAAHHVRRLALFGSAMGEGFDEDSVLDVLGRTVAEGLPALMVLPPGLDP